MMQAGEQTRPDFRRRCQPDPAALARILQLSAQQGAAFQMRSNLSPDEPGDGFGARWLSRFQSPRLKQATFAVIAPMLVLLTTYLLFFN